MAKKAQADPLDGVRISDPVSKKSAEDEIPKPRRSRPRAKPKPEPPDTPSEPDKPPEPEPRVPPPSLPVRAPEYRVTAMRRLSLRGQMVVFKLGKIISEDSHGPGIIEMLVKAGVPLEKVEPPKEE